MVERLYTSIWIKFRTYVFLFQEINIFLEKHNWNFGFRFEDHRTFSAKVFSNFCHPHKIKFDMPTIHRNQTRTIQLMLHLRTTFDNFGDIFLICLNKIFYILYFKKNCFYAIYKLYYFTNLIFWNNFYENVSILYGNVSIRPQDSILKPKARIPVHKVLTCLYN